MLTRNSAQPLYIQVQNALEADIRDGKYGRGKKLPSEKELCQQYEVSRITARKALEILEQKGIIHTVQGKGSYVRKARIYSGLAKISTLGEMLAENGYEGYTRILGYSERPMGQTEKLWAGPEWNRVSHLSLLGYAGQDPFVLYRSTINSTFGAQMYRQARLLEEEGEAFSTFDIYPLIQLGIGKINQQILAINADQETAQILKLPEGDAVLVLESIILGNDMRTIEHKRGYYRTDKCAFTLHRQI